jgi:hypothetical protein
VEKLNRDRDEKEYSGNPTKLSAFAFLRFSTKSPVKKWTWLPFLKKPYLR